MIEFSYHTKQKWGGAKAFKDSGYFYTTIRVKDDGENLYLKANGKGKPTVYLTVRRFREYTAVEHCYRKDIDLEFFIETKMKYNRLRGYRHGGKKY